MAYFLTLPPRGWMDRAACRDVENPDIFFPILPRGRHAKQHNKVATDICGGCEVIDDCLAYALDANEPYGIWGGLTTRERRDLRRKARTENVPYSSLISVSRREDSTS